MNGGKKTVGVLFNEACALIFNKANFGPFVAMSGILLLGSMIIGGVVYVVELVLTIPLSFLPVLPFIGAAGSWQPGGFDGSMFNDPTYSLDPSLLSTFLSTMLIFAAVMLAICLVVTVVAMAMSIALNTVGVSTQQGSLQIAEGRGIKADELFRSFGRNWKRYLGITAWSTLWVFLWSLLFYVPGIIKYLSYSMAPYLVIQYPELTVKQALRKSMQITEGYKGRLFGILLIILGFEILAGLTFCLIIGPLAGMLLFVLPLNLAMMALAYADIRNAAIERGLLPPVGGPDGSAPEPGKTEADKAEADKPAPAEPEKPAQGAEPAGDEPVPDENGDVPMAAGSGGGVEGHFVELEEDSPQL